MRKENYTPKPKVLIIIKDCFVMTLTPFHNGLFDIITNDTCPTEYFKGDLCYNKDTKQIVSAATDQWISICQVKADVMPIESHVLFGESFEMMEPPICNIEAKHPKGKPPANLYHIGTDLYHIRIGKAKEPKKKLKVKVKFNEQN